MSPLAPETTPPSDGDDSFTPSEDRLLFLLRRKIAGEPLPLPAAAAAHFHDADIYAADPALLTKLFEPALAKKGDSDSGSWYFFTRVRPKSSNDSRKSRQVAGGVGTWHSERAPRRVLDGEGNCVGHSQYFSYKLRTGKNCSERTEWYMVELSQDQEADHDHQRAHGGEPQLVLCKIYKAHTHSRSSSGSASRPSSCSVSARKRKAPAVDVASAPVKAKRRLFDSPAPAPAPASAVNLQEQFSLKDWIVGEPSTSHDKIDNILLDWLASMSQADGGAATSPEKMNDASAWFPFMSMADDKAATTSQHNEAAKIGDTSDFSRFWPEPEATFDGGEAATSQGANAIEVGDLFCGRDAWSTAFVGDMPSAPVLPRWEACWWPGTGSHDVWSF